MDVEYQIPPILPLQKGGIFPLWQRGAGGDFRNDMIFRLLTPLSGNCVFAELLVGNAYMPARPAGGRSLR